LLKQKKNRPDPTRSGAVKVAVVAEKVDAKVAAGQAAEAALVAANRRPMFTSLL
jgi:hypothetical protein